MEREVNARRVCEKAKCVFLVVRLPKMNADGGKCKKKSVREQNKVVMSVYVPSESDKHR